MSAADGRSVGVLGLGEVGEGIAVALAAAGVDLVAYDIRPVAAAQRLADVGLSERVPLVDLQHLATRPMVISAVIPAAAEEALRELAGVAGGVRARHYLDVNSTGPAAKRTMAEVAASAGMQSFTDATIGGGGFRLPPGPVFHLAGPGAARWASLFRAAGFRTDVLGDGAEHIGLAARLKMVRSSFTKGYEALMVESLAVASEAGLLDQIVESIGDTFDHLPFRTQAEFMVPGHVAHCGRRLGEVRMAQDALESLAPGVSLPMLEATERLFAQSIASLGDRYGVPQPGDLAAALREIRPRAEPRGAQA